MSTGNEFFRLMKSYPSPTVHCVCVPYCPLLVSYSLSAGSELYATGSNIREPDGTLNQARRGEVVFWQTTKPEKK